eukprot:21231-Heterococcus_DN1.PRE.4
MKLCLAAKLTKDPDEARKKLNDCCNSAHKGLSYKQRQGSRNPSQAIWELKEQPGWDGLTPSNEPVILPRAQQKQQQQQQQRR